MMTDDTPRHANLGSDTGPDQSESDSDDDLSSDSDSDDSSYHPPPSRPRRSTRRNINSAPSSTEEEFSKARDSSEEEDDEIKFEYYPDIDLLVKKKKTSSTVEELSTAYVSEEDILCKECELEDFSYVDLRVQKKKTRITSPTIQKKISSPNTISNYDKLSPFWKKGFDQLMDFKIANGHCLVPHEYPQNRWLGKWVKEQRAAYKAYQLGKKSVHGMTPTRIKMLKEIGFVWDVNEKVWNDKFKKLLEYKQVHGDCLVPLLEYPQDPSLGRWVETQRDAYKAYLQGKKSRYKLTPERIKMLREIELELDGTLKANEVNALPEAKIRRAVQQIDKTTNQWIRDFESISEASRETGIQRTGIFNTVCGKKQCSAGGFKWRYKDDAGVNDAAKPATAPTRKRKVSSKRTVKPPKKRHVSKSPEITKIRIRRSIQQIDKTTNQLIRDFESISEASHETGINNSSIYKAASGKRPAAGGFKWRYKDEGKPDRRSGKRSAVQQIDKSTNKLIRDFESSRLWRPVTRQAYFVVQFAGLCLGSDPPLVDSNGAIEEPKKKRGRPAKNSQAMSTESLQ